jgi:hypothetical protein
MGKNTAFILSQQGGICRYYGKHKAGYTTIIHSIITDKNLQYYIDNMITIHRLNIVISVHYTAFYLHLICRKLKPKKYTTWVQNCPSRHYATLATLCSYLEIRMGELLLIAVRGGAERLLVCRRAEGTPMHQVKTSSWLLKWQT